MGSLVFTRFSAARRGKSKHSPDRVNVTSGSEFRLSRNALQNCLFVNDLEPNHFCAFFTATSESFFHDQPPWGVLASGGSPQRKHTRATATRPRNAELQTQPERASRLFWSDCSAIRSACARTAAPANESLFLPAATAATWPRSRSLNSPPSR